VNGQIHDAASPILYQQETFCLLVQPRRAFLFSHADNAQPRRFELLKTNDIVHIRTHRRFALINKWHIAIGFHSVKGKGKGHLRATGLSCSFACLQRKLVYLDINHQQAHNTAFLSYQSFVSLLRHSIELSNALFKNIQMGGCWKAAITAFL
jgi:hypothetical protein